MGKETAYDASAQYLLTDALGAYEMSDGFRPSGTVEFSASALDAVLSPDGKRAAVIYPWSLALIDTGNGEIIAEYNVERSAMSRVLFPNETLAVFAGEGGIQAMDARTGELKWSGKPATGLTCSADGTRVAAVYRTESEAYIYEAETGALLQTVSFGGRKQRVAVNDIYIDERDNLLTLNADGSLLAVSFSDGSLSVFDTANGTEKILLDPNDYTHFEGGFYQSWVAFCASGGSQKPFFAAVDLNDRSKDLTALLTMPYMVQADERGIYLAGGNTLVRLDPVTAEQTEIAYTSERDIAAFRCAEDYSIVATENPGLDTYNPTPMSFYNGTPMEAQQDIHAKLHGAFVAFARSGEPANAAVGLDWAPYTAETRAAMSIDLECALLQNPNQARLDAWGDLVLYEHAV